MLFRKRKFAVDVMLGRLARWLRIFGYDTIYDKTFTDAELLYTAIKEKRILITRDRKLAKRAGKIAFLMNSEFIGEQIRELEKAFKIKPHIKYTRCSLCNTPIKSIKKEFVKDKVPPYTYMITEEFYICPSCNKVYWEGSHRKRAEKEIERLFYGNKGDT